MNSVFSLHKKIFLITAILGSGSILTGLFFRPIILATEQIFLSEVWWAWQNPPPINHGSLSFFGQFIYAVWLITGVSDWVTRLIVPIFAVGTLFPLMAICRHLWPQEAKLRAICCIVWMGSGGYMAYVGVITQDFVTIFLNLWATRAAFDFLDQKGRLPKFQVLLALLGLFLISGWYGLIGICLPILGAWRIKKDKSPLNWPNYAKEIAGLYLLTITVGIWVILLFMGHHRPWGGYYGHQDLLTLLKRDLFLLPLLLFPWLWWPRLWRVMRTEPNLWRERQVTYCLTGVGGGVLAIYFLPKQEFSAFLPLLPFMAMIVARGCCLLKDRVRDFHAIIPAVVPLILGIVALLFNMVPLAHLDVVWYEMTGTGGLPIWLEGTSWGAGAILLGGGYLVAQISPRRSFSQVAQLAFLPLICVAAINLEFSFSLNKFFDTQETAHTIATRQKQGQKIAMMGNHNRQFDFLGRLQQQIPALLSTKEALGWAVGNPQGLILMYYDGNPFLAAVPEYVSPGGQYRIIFWSAVKVLATNGKVLDNYQ